MSRGLTNIFVDRVLLWGAEHCIGVFSCDAIPFSNRNVYTFVCNLSKTNEIGTHFVAVSVDKATQTAEYYDSFGRQCQNGYILAYLEEQHVKKMNFNGQQIQSYMSDFCGIHCIAYVLSKNNNVPLMEFVSMYNTHDLMSNDNVSLKYTMTNL